MAKKLILSLLALAVIVPAEIFVWVKWVAPFFWSPGVAYTQMGWGYVLIGLMFVFIPVATVGSIFEED